MLHGSALLLGERAMSAKKLLNWKQVRDRIPLSRTHVTRLEKQGKFPKRHRAGDYLTSRVFWIEDEIDAHIQKLLDKRDS